MCYSVYIGINEEQELGTFVPELTDIYFKKLSKEEEIGLKLKFTKPYIYYVGSDTSCSCGLQFDSDNYNDPEEEINKKSPTKFIEFLKEKTKKADIEFYCC